ncbi:MAG: tetratricopeptide repeat protein, partial [Enterovibrio sp.]
MKLKVLLLSIAIGCMSMVSHAMDWSEKPFRVVQQAAEKGNAAAQYSLASMYAQGRGVGQDLKQAMQWYKKAAEQG